MRKFLIDTDTASDDAVALLMALREPEVSIEAITTVCGNCPLDTASKNALVTIEKAATYAPPVYKGMARPILRDLHTCENVHGEDGMGDMNLPEPSLMVAEGNAVDKIIEYAYAFPGELEIITIGPLTNVAMAIRKDPAIQGLIKHIYIMGGTGLGPGNITPVAEFNFWVDAEAASIVIQADVEKTVIGWDVCMDETFLNQQDIAQLNECGELGQFSVRCNKTLIEFNKSLGKDGFDLPDPTAVAVALYPELIVSQFSTFGEIEHKSDKCYGQFMLDRFNVTGNKHNVNIITKIDASGFKNKLIELLSD
ncbi:nucleoside hydrolase [Vibrio sp. SCSIO 43137]|uniref:nucleoside hydrolase n=1 Tax=Vibrio sp. SCSIO 43137 TaxID=3021011 RepID=UPI002307955E|nr:nucleoside hydrolase [Vibrio sp. SCSIO 43137]WCE30775.1 nucleoside hydrolase [Vibrio sp. SCSIO 43137]